MAQISSVSPLLLGVVFILACSISSNAAARLPIPLLGYQAGTGVELPDAPSKAGHSSFLPCCSFLRWMVGACTKSSELTSASAHQLDLARFIDLDETSTTSRRQLTRFGNELFYGGDRNVGLRLRRDGTIFLTTYRRRRFNRP